MKPHIILLMADQLRWDCLSCYGDIPVRTPHIDAPAEESVVFRNAYCATPLCGPTRTTMYTGKSWRAVVGVIDGRRCKYVYTPGDIDELYDLALDPGHRAIRDELAGRLSLWMEETGDQLPPGQVKR